MHAQNIAFALVAASGTFAAPAMKQARTDGCASNCNYEYNECRGQPDANRSTCASQYAACLGYTPFDDTGSLVTPTACSSTVVPTSTSTGIPGGCNPAHPGSCPTSTAIPTFTSIPGIPGGCNPAHPGSCPSSYFTYPNLRATAQATATAAPVTPPVGAAAVVEGTTWTVKSLDRFCGPENTGCDYNFALSTGGSADEKCTVVRTPGSGATTESWYDIPCTTGSANSISWGYSTQFGVDHPFAVLTVVNYSDKTHAYFGVSNVSASTGSSYYGDIGPQPVSTF